MESQNFISPREFAQRSGLSESTVRRHLKSGSIPCLQVGGAKHRIIIPADVLQASKTSNAEPYEAFKRDHRMPGPVARRFGPRPRWMNGSEGPSGHSKTTNEKEIEGTDPM